MQLCKPLIRAIDSLVFKDKFQKSEIVTYRLIIYYLLYNANRKLRNVFQILRWPQKHV